jgi:tetratricopeptide (TPR) repeat protein
LEELGLSMSLATSRQLTGTIELMAGDPVAAEREFRDGYERLQKMGEKGFQVTAAAMLARALYAQERFQDAEEMTKEAEELAAGDPLAKADWAGTRAKVMAARGEVDDAVVLAQQAVSIFTDTDETRDHADALIDLAEVLSIKGDTDGAREAAREALELYEQKGIISGRERAERYVNAP